MYVYANGILGSRIFALQKDHWEEGVNVPVSRRDAGAEASSISRRIWSPAYHMNEWCCRSASPIFGYSISSGTLNQWLLHLGCASCIYVFDVLFVQLCGLKDMQKIVMSGLWMLTQFFEVLSVNRKRNPVWRYSSYNINSWLSNWLS